MYYRGINVGIFKTGLNLVVDVHFCMATVFRLLYCFLCFTL